MRKYNIPTDTECKWIIKLAENDIAQCKQGPDADHPVIQMRIDLMKGIIAKMNDHMLSEKERCNKVNQLSAQFNR